MPYTKVIAQLKTSLQTAYRQALDADARLEQLQRQGHGKFAKIFNDELGFSTSSHRFIPYVEELAKATAELEQAPQQAPLQRLVTQLAALLQMLAAFKEQSRE